MAKRRPTTEETPAQENTDFNPFLKAEDVQDGDTLTMTGWVRRTTGRYGPQIVIEVEHKRTGRTFDFGVKDGSPNHRKLFKRFGADTATWKGELFVSPQQTKNGRGTFVSIDAVSDDVPF